MKNLKTILIVIAVAWSVVMLVFSPLGEVLDSLKDNAPILGVSLIASEVLFIIGLVLMALSLGIKVRNPFKLRRHLKEFISSISASKLFWVGFFVNLVGAVMTAIIGLAGVMLVLPVASWPIALIFLVDLWATLEVRKAVFGTLKTKSTGG